MSTRISLFLMAILCLTISHVSAVPVEDTKVTMQIDDGWSAMQAGDFATAFKLWKPLADQGYARAQGDLGLLYDHGNGVPYDIKEAISWYRKAAEQGYALAQFKLGEIYRHTNGMAPDYPEAAKWYRTAADQGHAPSQLALATLYSSGMGVLKDSRVACALLSLSANDPSLALKANLMREAWQKSMSPKQIEEVQLLTIIFMKAQRLSKAIDENIGKQ